MFHLTINEDNAETLLRESGYVPHWKGLGWVRDLTDKKRWHVYANKGHLKFHLDYTTKKKNLHYMVSVHSLNNEEKQRILKVNTALFGLSEKQIRKKLYPNRIAPNVKELQKMISKLNSNLKRPSLFQRFLNRIKMSKPKVNL